MSPTARPGRQAQTLNPWVRHGGQYWNRGSPWIPLGGYSDGMDTARAAAFVAPHHQARPGRGVLVAADLADLHGPAHGSVELPLSLFWSAPERTFDLDDPEMRAWMYEIVLREAVRPGDLLDYLDRDTLIGLWPSLWLPKGVRRAWEDQHRVLRVAAAA